MTGSRRGFTIVELLVVIVIIGILTTVVSLQVSRGHVVARDRERENDVKIITDFFEEAYRNGQAGGVMIPNGESAATPLGYPSTALISNPAHAQSKAILGALDQNVLKSPTKGAMSLVAATNTNGISGTTVGGITVNATAVNDVYVYQPFTDNGLICTSAHATQPVIAPRLIDACVKFIMYYFSEATNTIQSKHSINSNSNGL